MDENAVFNFHRSYSFESLFAAILGISIPPPPAEGRPKSAHKVRAGAGATAAAAASDDGAGGGPRVGIAGNPRVRTTAFQFHAPDLDFRFWSQTDGPSLRGSMFNQRPPLYAGEKFVANDADVMHLERLVRSSLSRRRYKISRDAAGPSCTYDCACVCVVGEDSVRASAQRPKRSLAPMPRHTP